MKTRRDVLRAGAGAMAGLVFTDCQFRRATPASAQTRRREVVVAGRRARTVDIHAHCAVPEALALLNQKLGGPGLRTDLDMDAEIAVRLAAMDEQGIDVEALSINPNWYKAEREVAQKLVKLQNEKLAEVCAKNPNRFVAFATVALQFPELAAEQLADGVKKLGLRGVAIGGNVAGEEISDPKFNPFWAKAEELGVLVFLHPQGDGAPAQLGQRFKGNGYLPSYAGRFDQGCPTRPDLCPGGTHGTIKKKPSDYMKQLYYDTMLFRSEGVRHLAAEVGAGQLMVGTDFPYPWTKTAVDLILETPGLSDDDKVAILGGTAARLLGLAA